jgi:hypothetical protein
VRVREWERKRSQWKQMRGHCVCVCVRNIYRMWNNIYGTWRTWVELILARVTS